MRTRHRYKLREMIASPICGALAAAYLTLPVVHHLRTTGLPLLDDDTTTLAGGLPHRRVGDVDFGHPVRGHPAKLKPTED